MLGDLPLGRLAAHETSREIPTALSQLWALSQPADPSLSSALSNSVHSMETPSPSLSNNATVASPIPLAPPVTKATTRSYVRLHGLRPAGHRSPTPPARPRFSAIPSSASSATAPTCSCQRPRPLAERSTIRSESLLDHVATRDVENGGVKHLLVDVDRRMQQDRPPLIEGRGPDRGRRPTSRPANVSLMLSEPGSQSWQNTIQFGSVGPAERREGGPYGA